MILTKCETSDDFKALLLHEDCKGREREIIDELIKALDLKEDGIGTELQEAEEERNKADQKADELRDTLESIGNMLSGMKDSITDAKGPVKKSTLLEALDYIFNKYPSLLGL